MPCGRRRSEAATKSALKNFVERNDTPPGRAFTLSVQALILLSLVGFSIETIPDLSPGTRQLLRIAEVITVALFSLEYALRVYVADSKREFVFSFYGMIDLLAILPFYLGLLVTGLGPDFRIIRMLRFFRLFRTLKLVRYSRAMRLFARAFVIAREELVLFFIATLMLFYLAAAGIWFFESEAQPDKFSSVFSSLWWAVVTLTTVGYGDVYPVTVGGRVFTFFLLMIGLGTIAVPSGIVAAALHEARLRAAEVIGSAERREAGEDQDADSAGPWST